MMKRPRLYRFFEMIPGSAVWATFILLVLFAYLRPLWVVYFIILFDLYWLFRVSYFVFYLIIAWRRYRDTVAVPWFERLTNDPNYATWDQYVHIIFLPTYTEPVEVLKTTFDSLCASRYPCNRFLVVLAGEEREREAFLERADVIQKEYGEKFLHLLVTVHPKNLSNEIPGKGSNLNYAGHLVKELLEQKHIDPARCIVSTFDVDTVVHPEYFSYLTLTYLSTPEPTRTSYQPIALYNNNIWDASAIIRVASFGTTFWLMTELARPERLFTFSSHSMSWQALQDVGFWQKDIVTEDSRIFLQCLLHYKGDYTVAPLYIPVSMDTVTGANWFASLKNLYKQQRRWAWGIEHFPYMMWNFWTAGKGIPFQKKLYYFWNLGEGMYSWATAPLIIFLGGRLPFLFAHGAIETTALFQNLPFILQSLMRLAMIGIFLSALLSIFLLPALPKHSSRARLLIMIFQWALLPVTLILFGSFPAIEAQTRLLFGRYLGFSVTEKMRKNRA